MHSRQNLTALKTIFTKEARRFLRIWVQTIVPPAITVTLYFIIFGNLIGSQIAAINGFSYMQFIVPGLIMMSIISNAYMNVSSSFFSTKFQKSVEELLVSSTPDSIIILGYTLGGMARGLMVGGVIFLVALCFTPLSIYNSLVLIAFAFLTSMLFSLAGLANAICAQKFDDISIIPTFVLTPLTYLGGVFYSLEQLPAFWQGVSRLNPILYMINGFRYGFLGLSDVSLVTSSLLLSGLCLGLYGLNLYFLKKGIGLRS